jgi:hypothetical protein
MLRVLNLLFFPEKEWQKMALTPPPFWKILFLSTLPILILSLAIEGYAVFTLGDVGSFEQRKSFPIERILKYETFSAVASLLVLLLGSKILQSFGKGFNLETSLGTCFTLLALSYTPIFLMRIPDGLPAINTWICWSIGALLSIRTLYHGIALWLRPEQTKGFGLFLMNLVYIVVLSGLVHFVSGEVLHGRFLKGVFPDKSVALNWSATNP